MIDIDSALGSIVVPEQPWIPTDLDAATAAGEAALTTVVDQQAYIYRLEEMKGELERTVQYTREQRDAWQNDFYEVASALREEADTRGWCSEYGEFVDAVNSKLKRGELEHCTKDFDVTFTISITVTTSATDEHDAAEIAKDEIGDMMRNVYSYDVTGVDVEEA